MASATTELPVLRMEKSENFINEVEWEPCHLSGFAASVISRSTAADL